jgi:bisphosphoglycerate-independent phosphoglycerate mutase (AlkP superfamily)
MFIEWRKIKGRYYAYARVAEWNRDRQGSLDEQIYLGTTPEKAIQKLNEVVKKFPRQNIDTHVLAEKLREKFPG